MRANFLPVVFALCNPTDRKHRMNAKTIFAWLFALVTLFTLASSSPAAAQKPGCTELCYIEDAKYKFSIVVGEAYYDGNVYHQPHKGRSIAKWNLEAVPGEPGYYFIRDQTYGHYLLAGDVYDNRVYHQPHRGRDNAKWRFVAQGEDGYNIIDKKHSKGLVAGDAYADNNVYHQDPGGRRNAVWSLTASAKPKPLDLPATPFALVDQRWSNAIFVANADYRQPAVPALHGLRTPADVYPLGHQTLLKFEAPDKIRLASGNEAWYLSAGEEKDNHAYFVKGAGSKSLAQKWTMTSAGCNAGFFRLLDQKHGLAILAGEAYVDGNIYHQPPNNRPVACWRAVAADEFARHAAHTFLNSTFRAGPWGTYDSGSGNIDVAKTLPAPPSQFQYGEPSAGLTVGSECRFWIPHAPCAKYKRHCAVAWNASNNPVLMVGSKSSEDGSGKATATSWMLVAPQSGRSFQSIGTSRYVTCAGCGNKTYIPEGWIPPTSDGNRIKPVYRWSTPGGGTLYVGTISTDNADCPNGLDLE